MPNARARSELTSDDPIKDATLLALKRITEPLIELMFDAGITVQEFSRLVRERAVRAAASRLTRDINHASRSRVAIITGLPRSEVARILNSADKGTRASQNHHPARKVLAAWYDDPKFLAENGDPAILSIFGSRKSFERLVALHSGGIPVRAMLDQLTQIKAVEILPGQRLQVKVRVPSFTGSTINAIDSIGERVRDLLDTLKQNMHDDSKPLFEGTAILEHADIDATPLIHREIAEQGAAFVDSVNSLFSRSSAKPRRSSAEQSSKCRIGVTVFYFQDSLPKLGDSPTPPILARRKNLHRKVRQSGSEK